MSTLNTARKASLNELDLDEEVEMSSIKAITPEPPKTPAPAARLNMDEHDDTLKHLIHTLERLNSEEFDHARRIKLKDMADFEKLETAMVRYIERNDPSEWKNLRSIRITTTNENVKDHLRTLPEYLKAKMALKAPEKNTRANIKEVLGNTQKTAYENVMRRWQETERKNAVPEGEEYFHKLNDDIFALEKALRNKEHRTVSLDFDNGALTTQVGRQLYALSKMYKGYIKFDAKTFAALASFRQYNDVTNLEVEMDEFRNAKTAHDMKRQARIAEKILEERNKPVKKEEGDFVLPPETSVTKPAPVTNGKPTGLKGTDFDVNLDAKISAQPPVELEGLAAVSDPDIALNPRGPLIMQPAITADQTVDCDPRVPTLPSDENLDMVDLNRVGRFSQDIDLTTEQPALQQPPKRSLREQAVLGVSAVKNKVSGWLNRNKFW